jgi:thioredoxin-related protein
MLLLLEDLLIAEGMKKSHLLSKIGLPVLLAMLMATVVVAQQSQVRWMSWDEVNELSKIEKKKMFVDIYTKWCGWCKKMDKTTYMDPNVTSYLNEHFYPVKLNAQDKEAIEFNNKIYKQGKRGYHELAMEITMGRLAFPTLVIVDEDGEVLAPIRGFQTAENLEMILTYIANDFHEKIPWHKFKTEVYEQVRSGKKKVIRP